VGYNSLRGADLVGRGREGGGQFDEKVPENGHQDVFYIGWWLLFALNLKKEREALSFFCNLFALLRIWRTCANVIDPVRLHLDGYILYLPRH
jgi:hypothetical protein